MNISNALEFFKNYKKGTYKSLIRETTTESGYTKRTKIVSRFVNYYNIKEVVMSGPKESKPREYEKSIIPHILKENLNTKNILLCAYSTKHHKPHTTYYYKGYKITKEEYYAKSGEKEKPYRETLVFNYKLSDIVSLG